MPQFLKLHIAAIKKIIYICFKQISIIKLSTPIKTTNLNDLEQSVLNAVQKEHLTSYEILQRVEDVSMLLSLYNILDKLSNKGILKSYVKQDTKYHYVA